MVCVAHAFINVQCGLVFCFSQGGLKTSIMITSTHTRAVESSSSSQASSSLLGWDSTIECWTKRKRKKKGGPEWGVENKSPTGTMLPGRWQKLGTERTLFNILYPVLLRFCSMPSGLCVNIYMKNKCLTQTICEENFKDHSFRTLSSLIPWDHAK